MVKGLRRSIERGDALLQEIIKVDEAVNIASFVVTDNSGAAGEARAVLRGLPEGNLLFLGAVVNLTFTKGDADIIDAFVGDFSIGSAPSVDNSALATDKANIIASTAIPAATAGVSPRIRAASVAALAGLILDNTDGSLELNLNILIDNTSIAADSSMVVEGEIHLAFIALGDD